MKKAVGIMGVLGVLIICGLFIFTLILPGCSPKKEGQGQSVEPAATDQAAAEFDLSSELKKTLDLGKESGLKGLELDRELGLLISCLSNMKNIATVLEMYNADNDGMYPDSLDKLTPEYLVSLPESRSSKGVVAFSYTPENDHKSFLLYLKGDNFSSLNIPTDYPKFLFDEQRIELRPGVLEPQKPLTGEQEAIELFEQGVQDLPIILQSKDAEKARAAREKLQAALDSGKLPADMQQTAQKMIERYREIEGK